MPAQQDDHAAQVRAVVERWAQAVRDHDLEGILAAHAATIVMFDVPPLQAKGLEAYAKTWEQFFAFQDKGAFDLNELEITASDTVAFCHSIVTCGASDPKSQFQVRLTLGLQKINGSWLIMHEHHSVPAEGGAG